MRDKKCNWCGQLWKDIPSVPGYMASDLGLIARFAPARTRTVPYILPASKSGRKYPVVKVIVDGKKVAFRSHRLICEAWHGMPEKKSMHCCHNNGDPSDNRPENLRWDTCKGNLADRKSHGTEMVGHRNGRAKLTWDLVAKMRSEFTGAYGDFERISRKYGVASSQTHEIIKKQSWWPIPKKAR